MCVSSNSFPLTVHFFRTVPDADFKSFLICNVLYKTFFVVVLSCMSNSISAGDTYARTSLSWKFIISSFYLGGELRRGGWLLRPRPILSSWQPEPSAQGGMDKMLTRAFVKTKDPCNLWIHKNTHIGKKRNKFFDIHTWNAKITDHHKRNPTGIKQRLWYTGFFTWWVKWNLCFL